jgi:hypothetical protein
MNSHQRRYMRRRRPPGGTRILFEHGGDWTEGVVSHSQMYSDLWRVRIDFARDEFVIRVLIRKLLPDTPAVRCVIEIERAVFIGDSFAQPTHFSGLFN